MTDSIRSPDLLLCKGSCYTDYLLLEYMYSPLYVALFVDSKTKQVALSKMSKLRSLVRTKETSLVRGDNSCIGNPLSFGNMSTNQLA